MLWKKQLAKLEHAKQWDRAIKYMQNIVTKNPDNLDAYLSINYLLMNLLVEEDYDNTKHDYYASLTKKYFDESYAKFSNNPEYLFFTGITAFMSEWYFDIDREDAKKMLFKALDLEPDNLLYQSTYYLYLDKKDPNNIQPLLDYANKVIASDSPIKTLLKNKGSLGAYILEITTGSNKRVIAELT